MTSKKIFEKNNYFSLEKDVIFTSIEDKAFILSKIRNSSKYYFFELNASAFFIIKKMQNAVNFEGILRSCKRNFESLSEKDIKEIKAFISKLDALGIIKNRKVKN